MSENYYDAEIARLQSLGIHVTRDVDEHGNTIGIRIGEESHDPIVGIPPQGAWLNELRFASSQNEIFPPVQSVPCWPSRIASSSWPTLRYVETPVHHNWCRIDPEKKEE